MASEAEDREWLKAWSVPALAADEIVAEFAKFRAEIVGWRKGVEDANKISQRYEGENTKLLAQIEDLKARGGELIDANQKRIDEVVSLRERIRLLEQDLHQARAEWQEEKKRARESEKEIAENDGVIKVLRRHRENAEKLLSNLHGAVCNYNDASKKEVYKKILDATADHVEVYLASIGKG